MPGIQVQKAPMDFFGAIGLSPCLDCCEAFRKKAVQRRGLRMDWRDCCSR